MGVGGVGFGGGGGGGGGGWVFGLWWLWGGGWVFGDIILVITLIN